MSEIDELITRLESFPQILRETVGDLTTDQLQTKIKNWSIATTVHHIADSHINSYIRIKLALTESNPTIKPYNESAWSTLADNSAPINVSLTIVEGIHQRICIILKSLSTTDWQKTFIHPEIHPSEISLRKYVQNFADHGEQHLKSIVTTIKKM